MPICGNNGATIGSLGIGTTDLFGHFDAGALPGQGNPVSGGNLVSSHVYMSGPPLGQPNATVQLGVYDTSPGPQTLWTLVATSNPFLIPAPSMPQWWMTPIAGVVTAGVTYATALLSVHAGGNPSVHYATLNIGGGVRTFIAPGVFPNPLGAIVVLHEWLIYTTYVLGDGRIFAALACCENCLE